MITPQQYFTIINEKTMSKDEVEDLIDDAEKVARRISTDPKRKEDDVETAKEVIQFVKDVRKTFVKNGSIHPNTLNSLSRITTGVNSGRYGYANKNSPKVPDNYSK
jgi:hypothetical protein